MIDTMMWVILGLIVALGIAALIIAYKRIKAGKKHETDYKAFFMMGIAFTIMGIFSKDLRFFLILGIAYMTIGLAKKSEWKAENPWSRLTKQEKKTKIAISVSLAILVLLGIILYLIQYFKVNP